MINEDKWKMVPSKPYVLLILLLDIMKLSSTTG